MNGTGNGEPESNKPTISWVTRTICLLAIVLGSSIPFLAYLGKPVSSEHNTIAGIVIGGLLSMLTKSTPTTSVPALEVKPIVPVQKLETKP
jgi:hypothetical protein